VEVYTLEKLTQDLTEMLKEVKGKKKVSTKSPARLKIRWRCVKCGFSKGSLDRHHITYDPCLIALLCRTCHDKVTLLNTAVAKSTYPSHKLSNEERKRVWEVFLKK
jgi:hypothetical protein